jgi:hypothetical protein
VGLLAAVVAGIAFLIHATRTTPWDIHDEHAFGEPKRHNLSSMAPSLILFGVLVAMIAGIGALDKGIWPPLAIGGDILGVALVPLAIARAFKTSW